MKRNRYEIWYINPPVELNWEKRAYVFPAMLSSSDSLEKAKEVAREKVKDMEDGRGATIFDNKTKKVLTQFMKEGGAVKEKLISRKPV